MSEDTILFLGDLQRLEVRPGDKFVLSLDEVVSDETARMLSKRVQEALGSDEPVIVLGRGMTLDAISPAPQDKAA